MTDLECDVAIIGAGTAGLAAERAARKAGARTLLIDDRFAGTTCATVGCMPSKLLIAAANAAQNARKASVFGLSVAELIIDGCAVMDRLRKERDAFVAATLKSIDDIPAGICVQQSIERGETAPTLLELPYYHPTFEESVKAALCQICRAIKAPQPQHVDDVAPPGA
jgi:dihydrolipoamide dehydrogenase